MPTPEAADSDFIFCDTLRGHKGQVLCVAAPESKVGEALVATGAEDSTVRLWDLRGAAAEGSSRVARCLCRCFDGEAVTSVVFAAGSANTLYCSAGGKVLEFDLRSGGVGSLLVTSPSALFDDGTDEVNELAVHPKGDYLAAADDSGGVKIYNTRTRRVYKMLRNAHTSICHAVRFRPRSSWDIASGALDSTLVSWDFSNGRVRRKLDLVNDVEFSSASASSSSGNQLFNPPFVNSVDFSADGRFLAAGLGDSSVLVLDAKTQNPVGRCDGHSAPISQVHYPSFDSKLLISSGNDQRLLFWDHGQFETATSSTIRNGDTQQSQPLHAEQPGGGSIGGGASLSLQARKLQKSGKKKTRAKAKREEKQPSVTRSQALDRRRGGDGGEHGNGKEGFKMVECSTPLCGLWLEDKPNWISSVTVPYDAVVVADTSSEAKVLRKRG